MNRFSSHSWKRITKITQTAASQPLTFASCSKFPFRQILAVEIHSCSVCLGQHKTGSFKDKTKPGSRYIKATTPAQPITAWFASPKGHDIMPPDEDIPMKERIKFAANWWQTEFKKLASEAQWKLKYAELRDIGYCHKDAETKIEYRFNNPETFDQFTVSADQDWDQGFSEAELLPSRNKTAIFRGYLDTRVPQDGTTRWAGWANLKSDRLRKSFGRAKHFDHWMNFTHFVIKVRGDGRIYMVNLNSPGHFDVTWGNLWSFPLFTHGGPYWQLTKIPFSKFYLNVYGRLQDMQRPYLRVGDCSSIGITLMDRITGPFQLEIDWIGVYYDISHKEEFAYELYQVPFGIR